VFDDGLVRTYTGAPDERRFFELVKVSETIELAANTLLAPVHDGDVDPVGARGRRAMVTAAVLLEALRKVNATFAALPPEEGLRPSYFMDVFRQFAVHWTPGDVPPSGALDPEAISRDLILGTTTPAYEAHLGRLMPGLLTAERQAVARLRERPTLPEVVLGRLGLDGASLAGWSPERLRRTVGRHPALAALYLLLNAHARASGVHLLLAKKFLFAPQRQRDAAGVGDRGVVSNRRGTTGMTESFLEELSRARRGHPLSTLRALGTAQVAELADLARVRKEAPADLTTLVRVVVPATAGGAGQRDTAGAHLTAGSTSDRGLTAIGTGRDDEAR
jgi:hypothetical protein